MGSGNPSRTICSTLIVEANACNTQSFRASNAFQIIRRRRATVGTKSCIFATTDYFVPRDFDVSPYFQIANPTIESGFGYRHNSEVPGLGSTY